MVFYVGTGPKDWRQATMEFMSSESMSYNEALLFFNWFPQVFAKCDRTQLPLGNLGCTRMDERDSWAALLSWWVTLTVPGLFSYHSLTRHDPITFFSLTFVIAAVTKCWPQQLPRGRVYSWLMAWEVTVHHSREGTVEEQHCAARAWDSWLHYSKK